MSLPSPFDNRVVFTSLVHPVSELFDLSPSELLVAPRGASAERRIEFALGRRAAHSALNNLGYPTTEPLPRTGRLPVWPNGVRGAISHTRFDGVIQAVAAATRDVEISGVGVDLEGVRPISERVLRRISHRAELSWVGEGDCARRAVALFAAREALFKAIHPLYGQPMLYRDTHLVWVAALGGFRAVTALPRLRSAPVESVVTVRYAGQLVLAGVVIEKESLAQT